MSKRPTTISRRDYLTANNSTNNYGYAIIGDTVSATLYAKRLLNNRVTTPIAIISEGSDRTAVDTIIDMSFEAINNKLILRYLNTEQIHMIPSGDNQDEIDDLVDTQTERIIQYHVGCGPLGDFISSYHIPRLGPWFINTSSGRLERFLSESTVKSTLNSAEIIVVDRIKKIWGINSTSSIVVNTPSVLNVHYEFLEQQEDTYIRELFLNQYHTVNQSSNSDYITEASNLRFTPTVNLNTSSGIKDDPAMDRNKFDLKAGGPGLYNITGNNISLSGVKPIWKTNSYTYLRLATVCGINVVPLYLPTFYRAVLSIPISGTGSNGISGTIIPGPSGYVCFSGNSSTNHISELNSLPTADCYIGLTGISGINLSNILATEDLITTHITFSLHDLANPKHTGIAWLAQAYTTPEDLSVIHPDGKYADSDRTLLIVEALSTKNKRRTSYNISDREIIVNYNDRISENGYLRQFALIVAGIYNSYTGNLISVDSLISDVSVCSSSSGICHDASSIVDYSLRESPMISIIELASHMYGVDIYPKKD